VHLCQHALQKRFKGYGMAAAPTSAEKVTIAVPFTVIKIDAVRIIIPIDQHFNCLEMKS
jgi:hypothetical protein